MIMTQASAGLPEKQEYDAVVLGSGPSELTCALLLARRGRSVLVVERGRALGGPAALREFAPGFRAALAPAEAGHVSRRLVTSLGLGEHGFSPEARHWPFVGVGEGSPPLVLSGDLAASQGSIAAVSKRDAEQWVSFATQMERLAAFMEALATRDAVVLTNGQDGLGARDLLSLAGHGLRLRSLGKADMIEMLRVLPMAVADVLEDRFESEHLKAMLAVTALANLFQGPRSGGTGPRCSTTTWGRRGGPSEIAASPRVSVTTSWRRSSPPARRRALSRSSGERLRSRSRVVAPSPSTLAGIR